MCAVSRVFFFQDKGREHCAAAAPKTLCFSLLQKRKSKKMQLTDWQLVLYYCVCSVVWVGQQIGTFVSRVAMCTTTTI